MKKSLACLGLVLLLVAVLAGPAAATANLAGNWIINGKRVNPGDGSVENFQITDLVIKATNDPTLFYGTLTSPDGYPNYMTIMMDSGGNMHFTASNYENTGNGMEYVTHTTGRGTANNNKMTGLWSDDRGKTGSFIMTRKP